MKWCQTLNEDNRTYCVLDFETFSEANLKKTGSYEYSKHPSTKVLCVAWRLGTRKTLRTNKTQVWASRTPSSNILTLLAALENPDVIIVAHNSLFELLILLHVLSRELHTQLYLKDLTPERFICTAALAAALALPRDLERAAIALKLPVQKDMDGNRLINKWCKPRKPTKNNPSTRHNDADEFEQIKAYCVTDVDTEVELFLRVPPLTALERKVWELDQRINLRGFQVDRPLVKTVLRMIDEEMPNLLARCVELSDGRVRSPAQVDVLLEWLEDHGVYLPNLQKKTIEDALAEGLAEGAAEEMLKLRQATAKTSTAKYQAFEIRSRSDSRLRDILKYHGASTGRWGGAGIQPQNFPRGSIKNTVQAAGILATGDLELIRLIYGNPMEVFSSCLRNMIVAPKGKILDVADYASIEVRVLFWVANHQEGLKALFENRPLYEELAAEIFGCEASEVSPDKRFIGKQATLGSGYGMGAKKFVATCQNLGKEVSQDLAEAAIKTYRSVHSPVVRLWGMLGKAAIAAVENPGKKYTINHTAWFVRNGFLWCELPSGRRLAYAQPSVVYVADKWRPGVKNPELRFWGVDSLSKKWRQQAAWGGVLTENVVQAIARDLMAEAMLRIEKAGWELVLSVHDELIGERFENESGLDKFIKMMEEVPAWGKGIPVRVEGWSGRRYRK